MHQKNMASKFQLSLKIVSAFFLLSYSLLSFAAEAPANSTFTEEQSRRGESLYQQECAICHGAELSGGAAPALSGQTFRRTWSRNGANVAELYSRIATTMPPRGAGSLGENQNLDILAFMLEQNNVLVGTEELRNDYNYLSDIPIARGDEVLDTVATFIEGVNGIEPSGTGPGMDELLNAQSNASDWLYHNHNYQGTRYSELDEINTSNVAGLQQVCAYQMTNNNTMQTGPIVYQGVMYVTNATHTAAIDAATCERIWSHDWVPKDRMVWGNNRGVAIKDGYVVRGTADGYIMALDSANGNLLWARQVADPWLGETFTMPPMIMGDTFLIGPAGSENAISGWVAAFTLESGEEKWRFHTVPEAAAGGGATWGNPTNIPLGGGAVWTPLSFNEELNEVYVAVTNPAPDLPAYLRPGDNLYTNNIVALNPENGELIWHKAIVPNDDHDWDLTQVSPVLKSDTDNVSRNIVATVGKDGMLRGIDLASHEKLYESPVTSIENADVPVTPEGVYACPGVTGGVLWSGPAYHKGENLLITPAVDHCARFTASDDAQLIPGQLYMGGSVESDEDMTGWLTAADAETGEIRWKYHSSLPMVAAVTATAGDLVISGELSGNLLAFDAASGDLLKKIYTGAPIGGGIISYEVDGKQYIATNSGNAMLTFNTGARSSRQGAVIIYSIPAGD